MSKKTASFTLGASLRHTPTEQIASPEQILPAAGDTFITSPTTSGEVPMSEHDQIAGLLADILAATRDTNEGITKLTEAIASGLRTAKGHIQEAKVTTDKVIKKAKAPPATELETPATPMSSEPVAIPAAAPAVSSPSYEQARDLIVGLERATGIALLARFNAKRLSDVPAEKYADLIAAAKDL
jgi:hypothetical protein